MFIEEIKKIEKEERRIQQEVRERTLTYVTTALGFVAGLAWNEAVKSLIEYFFPFESETLSAKFFYAVFVTVIAVIFTLYLGRIFDTQRNGEKKNRNHQSTIRCVTKEFTMRTLAVFSFVTVPHRETGQG